MIESICSSGHNYLTADCPTCKELPTMSRTATIIAEMRAENSAAIERHNDRMATKAYWAEKGEIMPSPLKERTTVRLSAEQAALKAGLLKLVNDGANLNLDRRVVAPAVRKANQLRYARPGHAPKDMLESLMAFFSGSGQLAHHLLLTSTAPGNVALSTIKDVLADQFVVDVIEGLGYSIPTQKALSAALSHSSGKGRGNGRGRPRKVHTYTDHAVCEAGGKGHYYAHLSFAMPAGRGIPGNGASTAACVRYLQGA